MRKTFIALISSIIGCLIIFAFAGCTKNNDSQGADTFHLTVQNPNGYFIENLQETYKAGEKVTVKTGVLLDVDMVAYLDGVSLGSQTAVLENGKCHWEFYFDMPEHDAVLTFELFDGFLPCEE